MNNALETVEQEIQRKGLTAPRVTPADIEANIASEHYLPGSAALQITGKAIVNNADTVLHAPLDLSKPHPTELLTICILVLRNGFTIVGTSACASPDNFDAELGRKIARQDAVRQMWPLMGYALREQLAAAPLKERPTIEQLETILRSEDNRPVQILPNGEVRVDER